MGAAAAAKGTLLALPEASEPVEVATVNELPVGGYKLFKYPTPDHPCILVHLDGPPGYVAFSQSCTHLMCPVYFDGPMKQFVCPCHEGFFDATDGSVIAGPPRRPLPRYEVAVKDGKIWVGPGQLPPEGGAPVAKA